MTRGLTTPEYGNSLWIPYNTVTWLQHPQITIRQSTIDYITDKYVMFEDGDNLGFDYLIVALGVGRHAPIGVGAETRDEFEIMLRETHANIKAAQSVTVVGAGAVGIELAADVKEVFPDKYVRLVHSREQVLAGPFSVTLRQRVEQALVQMGVEVVLGQRVVKQRQISDDKDNLETAQLGGQISIANDMNCNRSARLPELTSAAVTNAELTLANGERLQSDWTVQCLGAQTRPILQLASKGLTGSDGIRVRGTMQVDDIRYPHIYACGDACSHSAVKLAGVAMHNGFVAARNIARCVLMGGPRAADTLLEQSPDFPAKILLLLGRSHCAMQVGDVLWDEERARQFVFEDMGLAQCVNALSLTSVPIATSPFDHPPSPK
ncbi:FAD/NAD(P)-binding domain-containing protein [Coemansia reversa NRRL 1564]|uniref:FAD/NAD(P)-binding domain-containing protein n=1 Tax=Coemansia reversa (strain ATCC 12441 / NRRL 1564) TaxID=763665 RepID=A0A2G5B3B6_COERN|nr:FAD/NAD(P)-binding domain-containing protein [Coemansia reversa NRRL 1564]|eukprot:PIA13508.1 FAD/NAD(P)-binding domain-containing protein [Coemansia reversa NRRL 1564]